MQVEYTPSNDAGLRSRDQAAKQLNISTRNLDYLRESGDLSYIKIGHRILFDPRDLEKFIEARKVVAA